MYKMRLKNFFPFLLILLFGDQELRWSGFEFTPPASFSRLVSFTWPWTFSWTTSSLWPASFLSLRAEWRVIRKTSSSRIQLKWLLCISSAIMSPLSPPWPGFQPCLRIVSIALLSCPLRMFRLSLKCPPFEAALLCSWLHPLCCAKISKINEVSH